MLISQDAQETLRTDFGVNNPTNFAPKMSKEAL